MTLSSLRPRFLARLCATSLVAATGLSAQQPQVMTSADYMRAAHQLPPYTMPLVDHMVRSVHWIDGTHFWYSDSDHGVPHLTFVDAATRTKALAFQTAELVASMHTAGLVETNPTKITFSDFELHANNVAVVTVRGERYECVLQLPYTCKKLPPKQAGNIGGYLTGLAPQDAVLSPDGKRAVFIRDWNLWVRDINSGAEKQLTKDGVKDFGYATDNAGWKHSNQAIVIWSPDSKMVATFQQDQRTVRDFTTTTTQVGHSSTDTWKYPFVGDRDIIHIDRVIVNVENGMLTRLDMPPDLHRSSLCDDIICGEGPQDIQWAADAKTLAFVSTSRDHKVETVRIADVATGKVRDVFTETTPTFFDSGYNDEGINWRYLSTRNEILWWSQRSNWGHYYLYDAASGKLKRQITSGDWNVDHLVYLNEKSGDMLIAGVGRERGEDPYYRSLYALNLRGGDPRLLTPERQDHIAFPSVDGKYFVDLYSTPQDAPTAVLRTADGVLLEQLEKADVTRLTAAGWRAPESIAVKCSDGTTLCYGLLFKPADLDSTKKYPIIDYVYPGPFTGTLSSRQFLYSEGDSAALAQLGFAVVQIDAMGTPRRSKQFQDKYFHDMGHQALPDQVSGIQDLATRYSWIDLGRVGIWGHSGGGNATASSMFLYPDFFKVGVAESGNHDNRNYEDDF